MAETAALATGGLSHGIGRKPGVQQGILAIVTMFLPTLAFISLPATLPKLLEHFADFPDANLLVPVIVTAPALCMALLAPVAGVIADLYGRRRILLAAILIYTVCGLIPMVVDDLRLIVYSRVGLGIGNAALLTLGATLIGDYFVDPDRRRWLAINGVAGAILATLAMLAGGVLADISWRGPFFLYAAGIPLFLFALYALWEPESPPVASGNGEAAPFPWSFLSLASAITVVAATLFFVQPVHIGLVLAQTGLTSSSEIAVVASLASIGVPLGSLIYGRLSAQPVSLLLGIIFGFYAVGLVGIGVSGSYVLVGFASFPQQMGNGMLIPALIHWVQGRAAFAVRARAMGIWTTAFFAGQFACPWIVSLTGAHLGGLQPAMLAIGLVSGLLMIAALFVRFGTRASK